MWRSGRRCLVRTPYGRGGPNSAMWELAAQKFASHGYHVIAQDVRALRLGGFTAFVNRTDDGVDSLAWMAMQPWCDGKIGVWGPAILATCGGPRRWWIALPQGAGAHHRPFAPHAVHENGFPLDLLVRWMLNSLPWTTANWGPSSACAA